MLLILFGMGVNVQSLSSGVAWADESAFGAMALSDQQIDSFFRFDRQEGSHRSYVRPGVARPVGIPAYKEVPVFVIPKRLAGTAPHWHPAGNQLFARVHL